MKREKLIGVYCIINVINSKLYIGKSIDIYSRKAYHYGKLKKNLHPNYHLQNSWNKHGENNFEFFIIEECDKKDLDQKEIFYIKKYKSQESDFGFNLTSGGDGGVSELAKGKRKTEEHKRNLSISRTGSKVSEKTKIKISRSMMGEKNHFYGKTHSAEAIAKIRSANSGENNIRYGTDFTGENNPGFGIKRKGRASKYYGVHTKTIIKEKGDKVYKNSYWVARLRRDRQDIYLGIYKEESDAALAYDNYVRENNLPHPLNFEDEK